MRKIVQYRSMVIFGILLLLFCFRFMKLDLDLPPWGVVNYQPMDEAQYATMAIYKVNYGTFTGNADMVGRDTIVQAHIRNNVFGNLLVYLGMYLGGDNYIGFRFTSGICGLLIFVFFYVTIRILAKKYCGERESKFADYVTGILGFALILDFPFFMASRVVETTIYRLLFVQLMIMVFVLFEENEWYQNQLRFLFLGFLVTISVFAVYITNIFVFLAILLSILFWGICKGKGFFWKALTNFASGSAIAFLLCDLYYYLVWGSSCIRNTLEIIVDFSRSGGYLNESGWIAMVKSSVKFISSNTNLYQLTTFGVFLMLLPYIVVKIIQKKDVTGFFLIALLLAYYMQTLINEDYVVRKYILMTPVMLLLIFLGIVYLLKEPKEYIKGTVVWSGYFVLCLSICMGIIIYRFYVIKNGTVGDFDRTERILVFCQMFFLLGIVVFVTVWMQKGIMTEKMLKHTAAILVSSCFLTGGFFVSKYVFLNNSCTEKKIMMELGEIMDDEYVSGIYSISYTLYNDMRPIVNDYKSMGRQMREEEDVWYLDYAEYDFPKDIRKYSRGQWEEWKNFSREYQTFGERKNISLYKVTYK